MQTLSLWGRCVNALMSARIRVQECSLVQCMQGISTHMHKTSAICAVNLNHVSSLILLGGARASILSERFEGVCENPLPCRHVQMLLYITTRHIPSINAQYRFSWLTPAHIMLGVLFLASSGPSLNSGMFGWILWLICFYLCAGMLSQELDIRKRQHKDKSKTLDVFCKAKWWKSNILESQLTIQTPFVLTT